MKEHQAGLGAKDLCCKHGISDATFYKWRSKYGLTRQIMMLVGFAELFGAIAIWFQGSWVGTLGALTLLGTSVCAIGCHLIWDTWKEGVPAMITGTLSAIVFWSSKGALLALLGFV